MNMKIFVCGVLNFVLAICFFSFGCNSSITSNKSLVTSANSKEQLKEKVSEIVDNSDKSQLDREAEELAKPELEKTFTSCGGNFYHLERNVLLEIKEPKIEAKSERPSEADELNNISWKGEVSVTTFGVTRSYNLTKYEWNEWLDNSLFKESVELMRKNGKWEKTLPTTKKQLACQELPFNILEKIKQQDIEAQITAEKEVKPYFIKCGNSFYFNIFGYQYKGNQFKVMAERTSTHEYYGLEYEVRVKGITEFLPGDHWTSVGEDGLKRGKSVGVITKENENWRLQEGLKKMNCSEIRN